MGSAYAEFQDEEKGSISVGKLADMVILSDDIFKIDPMKIRDVRVLKTFVGGRITWDADKEKNQTISPVTPRALSLWKFLDGE
jgi:hypothetical protein